MVDRTTRTMEPKRKSPLPVKKIAILGLILAANNMSVWMIFSFLPFMVSDFFPYLSTKELGYRAGILGSAFSCGSLLGNFMWGVIADKYGRRPALLLGLLGTALSAILFGLAPTFMIAVIARFMWGFLNGNIGVSKTYVAEILDDTNTPRGMAVFGVIGGVGRTIGPVIGGFLSSPAKMYPVFQGTLFEKYPYALPCMVISANCAVVFALAFIELQETLKSRLRFSSREEPGVMMTKRSNRTAYSQLNTDSDDNGVEVNGLDNEMDQSAHGLPNDQGNCDTEMGASNPMHKNKSHLNDRLKNGASTSSLASDACTEDDAPPPPLTAIDGHPIRSHDMLGSPIKSTEELLSIDMDPPDQQGVCDSLLERTESNDASRPLLMSSSSTSTDGDNIASAKTPNRLGSSCSSASPHISPRSTHEQIVHNHFSKDGVRFREVRLSSISSDEISAMGPCDETNLSVPTKKHVSFSSLVMVKVIGSGSVGFGQLKHLQPDDNPLDDDDDEDDIEGGGARGGSASALSTARERMFRFTNGAEFNASLEAHYGSFWTNIKYLLTKRSIVVTTSMYGLAAFVQLVANEIFPLWVVTSIRDGGLDFSSHNIGVATMISGPIIIAMQVGVYPFLVEKYGVLRIFSVGCDLFALACFFIPAVSLIPGQEESKLRWIFVVLGLSVIGTSAMWVFTSIFVLINNSCYSHERATVNGIGQTCASLGRFTGPYLGALTFAWSENNRLQWPFDYFFTWYLIGMISIGNSYLTKLLPRSIERRKREPREPRYAVTMMGTAGDETPGNDYDESNTVPLLGSPTSSGRGGRKRRPRRRFRFPDDSDDEVKDPTGKVASGPEKGSDDNNSVSADSPLLASSEEKTTSNASPNSRNSGLQDVESKAFDRLPV